jgi:hypothetical protein
MRAMKPTLIPNWRRAARMFSVQVATIAVAWGSMPQEWQQAALVSVGVPSERVPAIFGLLFLLGRVIRQPRTEAQP